MRYEAELWSDDGDFLEWIKVPNGPICGADFCGACNECLACECEYLCEHSEDSEHPWIVWEHQLAEFLENHAGAGVRG